MYFRPILLIVLISGMLFLKSEAAGKFRVVILTDQTHDDGNSLIGYLYYSHLFDTEAIIVTPQLPDFKHTDDGPWRKAQGIIKAYSEEFPHLKLHNSELIDPET
jgi:hypothetical protein